MTDDLEQRLCDAIEPVLAKYGIPLYGLPLRTVASPEAFKSMSAFMDDENVRIVADGVGDRGDMTSDIATAVLEAINRIRYGMVVVTHLMAGECPEFEGRDCVQAVIVAEDGLPFPDKESADREAATWPDWCSPHTMRLSKSRPPMRRGESGDEYAKRVGWK